MASYNLTQNQVSTQLNQSMSFDDTLPKEFNKEKKMSLLIAVLLDIIFSNKEKLAMVYKYLESKKLINLDVIDNEYSDVRNNLSFLVQTLNGMNVLNDKSNTIESNSIEANSIESNTIKSNITNLIENQQNDTLINMSCLVRSSGHFEK